MRGRATLAAAGLLVAVVGCSSDGDGPTGRPVALGTALAGDAVPLIDLGSGDRPARVHLITAGSEEPVALPALPDDVWFWAADALADERWVVVSAGTCPEPTTVDDIGPGCPDGRSTAAFFAFDRRSEEWSTVPYEGNVGDVAEPRSIEGDVVRLLVHTPETRFATLDLAATAPALEDAGDVVAGAACNSHQEPAATIDPAAPEQISLTPFGAVAAQLAPLPVTAQPAMAGSTAICSTAGEFLATAAVGPSEALGDTRHLVFAPLRGEEPIAEVPGSVTGMVAGVGFAVLELGGVGLQVVSADGRQLPTPEVTVDDGQRRVAALAHAVVVVVVDPDGDLRSIEVHRVEP